MPKVVRAPKHPKVAAMEQLDRAATIPELKAAFKAVINQLEAQKAGAKAA